ncbi:hypothetical protein HHI36_003661 [Cryptolaemus montrouzieri]|uniref:WD repeat-containing protein 89 n=1 Tax=Cryptolaemus montrouzieri TaxID=559131 RepID=A0ABD2PES9_9CUCU
MDPLPNIANQEENREDNEGSDVDVNESSAKEFPEALKVCEKLIDKNAYILHLAATKVTHPNIAAALTNHIVEVYHFHKGFQLSALFDHGTKQIVDLQFSEENDNLLWTATHGGPISLWDLRVPYNSVSSYTDTTDDKEDKDRKINCFDISLNGRIICAGTDAFEGDAFLLYWDIRKSKLIGGFWESHRDDITQVKFHPTETNKMLSGSTDGLINSYDLNISGENNALIESMNTESSVEKISWSKFGSREIVTCITHTAHIQLWRNVGVYPYCNFTRADLARNLKRTSANHVYIVDMYQQSKRNSLIIAGSNVNNGSCVRGLRLERKSLKPAFSLPNNPQRIRCSWYNENDKLLLTGGEKDT